MNTKPFILVALSLTLIVQACGDGASTQKLARTWDAGDIDPYGCPFIDPVPWVSVEAHREACGAGCEPSGTGSTLVACIGDEVPRYPREIAVPQVTVCLTHPVDGEDYSFGNLDGAWPVMHLCWRTCGSDLPLDPSLEFDGVQFDPPVECFEE